MTASSVCQECQWWLRRPDSYTNGECHRRAPLPMVSDTPLGQKIYWPETRELDWCGDFKKRDRNA